MKLTHLTDEALLTGFQDSVIEDRERLLFQLESLIELDRRKLFLHYESLRAFLIEEHGMEDWFAARLIRAARTLQRFPELGPKFESGKINLTLLELAQGCAHRAKLSDPEFLEVVEAVAGMSCRAAMREIATQYPHSSSLPRDQIRPLNDEFSEVRFVANGSLLEKFEDIRGLLAHSNSGIKLGELIEVIATDYLDRHHPEAKAERARERKTKSEEKAQDKCEEPKPTEVVNTHAAPRFSVSEEKRTPSASMVHELIERDGYQCSYVDPITQKRCKSKYGLEIDHIQPWSLGGETELANLRYLCKPHHRRVSFLKFGESLKFYPRM